MNTNLPIKLSDLLTGVTPVTRTSLTISGKEVRYIDFGQGVILVSDYPTTTFRYIVEIILVHNLTIGYGCIMDTMPEAYEQAMLKLKNELSHFPVKHVPVKTSQRSVYKLDYGIKP